MNISLRKVSEQDGERERHFLLSVPDMENGFGNKATNMDLESIESFQRWTQQRVANSLGRQLPPGFVPSTVYYVERDNEIVGLGEIRHYLNEYLLETAGGHIGLGGIPETYRGQGIGTAALQLLIEETFSMGESEVLLGVHEYNTGSRMIVERNGGILEKYIQLPDEDFRTAVYWIRR